MLLYCMRYFPPSLHVDELEFGGANTFSLECHLESFHSTWVEDLQTATLLLVVLECPGVGRINIHLVGWLVMVVLDIAL
jgi:hypothetical protein